MSTIKCSNCQGDVPSNLRHCPSCGDDCGYPNVRLASQATAVEALEARFHSAEVSTEARNCLDKLLAFGAGVDRSRAVIARPLNILSDWVENEASIYTSYQRQVASGARVPQDNEWDKVRTQYESALYPNFYVDIVFGSLTLSTGGMSGYGGFSIFLKEKMVAHRASLFEENPHDFVQRHKVLLNQALPPGYRAVWSTRGKLAMVKLHSKIVPETEEDDWPAILQADNGGTGNSDFIEVHIYGSLNRNAIESVAGKTPKTREDRLLWKRVKRKLAEAGAGVQEL